MRVYIATATIRIAGRAVNAALKRDRDEVRLTLAEPVRVTEGQAVEVTMR
jgi:hypothetical protein